MYKLLKPIIEHDPNRAWLTVGDGRYGTDANALIRLGANRVMCTDISDKLLKLGNAGGFIADYSAQNAEALTFDADSYDFVLCKEAYHHFPRPHIALHEMLRVARVGVVLMEPNDPHAESRLLNRFLHLIKNMLGRNANASGHGFEPVGNYVFSTSKREFEKVQLGMHRRFIAFKEINDYYQAGFEFIPLNGEKREDRSTIRKAKVLLNLRNLLSKLGLVSSSLLVSILFKGDPDNSLLLRLAENGWQVKELPKNPFL
jgi:ubiquinone/menaquinone biosynthesis C-methylase UbiE